MSIPDTISLNAEVLAGTDKPTALNASSSRRVFSAVFSVSVISENVIAFCISCAVIYAGRLFSSSPKFFISASAAADSFGSAISLMSAISSFVLSFPR